MAILKKKNLQRRQESIPQQHVILSYRTRKYIGKSFRLGQLTCSHPYEWNAESKRPEFTTSSLRLIAWFFNFAICTAYSIFVIAQCIRTNTSDDVEGSTKIFMAFASILFSLPLFFNLNYLIAWRELPAFVSGYFSYCDKFEDKFIQADAKPSKAAKISELFTTYTYYAFTTDGFLIFGLYGLSRLDSPEQLSSLFQGRPILQIFTSLAFSMYYGTSFVANGLVIVETTFAALFAFFDILAALGKDNQDMTNEAFDRPRERVQAYRALLLYADATDRVYWLIHASAKYILMFVSMLCTYSAIRLGGVVSFALAVFGLSTTMNLMAFLNGWAAFYSGSINALRTLVTMTTAPKVLENERSCAWLRKTNRSLRVARLPICGAYYIDKELVLNVIKVIIDGIIFLLVNF